MATLNQVNNHVASTLLFLGIHDGSLNGFFQQNYGLFGILEQYHFIDYLVRLIAHIISITLACSASQKMLRSVFCISS